MMDIYTHEGQQGIILPWNKVLDNGDCCADY